MTRLMIPRNVVLWLTPYWALAFAFWIFIGTPISHWVQIPLAALIAAIFLSSGVSLALALQLLLRIVPGWLTRTHAAWLAIGAFMLQSALAGLLTIFGVWPYPKLWFLGAIPFLWH
jgi:hypothetical protein